MDDTALVRTAARGVVDDITPSPLRELLETRLQNSSMTPGALTRLSARATNKEYDIEELNRHAAGVQLIYSGLDSLALFHDRGHGRTTMVSPIGETWIS